MTPTWDTTDAPLELYQPKGVMDWLRVLRRGVPGVLVIAIGFILLLALRLIERPVFGQKRPLTPYVTCAVCTSVVWLIGFRLERRGKPMGHQGAVVANHASWLDIFTLNARQRIYFVSKSEVAGWPGIGVLAKATGTLFIARKRIEAKRHEGMFKDRLAVGHKLLFFPEGTSTDATRVLAFKSSLFQAFFAEGLRDQTYVQPVTVNYHAPKAADDPRYYGWWGDMALIPNILHVLATPKQGRLEVVFQGPLMISDYQNRKSLTADLERAVKNAHFSAKTCKNTQE